MILERPECVMDLEHLTNTITKAALEINIFQNRKNIYFRLI